ncbi:two-component system, sensor histidine kinase YesM [Paenibacillus sp. UNCCL117]|uniref:sensor histidine kinase n=1 Tax=unclassified Paenibacillus TaxID=185978 RepID=UPI00088FFB8A|nr:MULTISPECIES: sensor histidine kinase [unclassified Paenibacillus]SDD48363.1 two-component system, sensor histidine kinase YesM [Paenibacillus sp. cl123]SFW50265.1 two-component system, sensor histidine kinase YesM [Paenibacillus sp. UNCCL117]
MNNDYKRHIRIPSLKRKFFARNLFSMLLPCLIPLLLLGSMSIFISDRYIRLDAERKHETMLNQYNELIQIIAAEVDSLSLSFDKDAKISMRLSSLLSTDTQSYENLEALFYLKNIIDVPANSKPYIHSIYIYSENDQGRFLSSREGLVKLDTFYDQAWFGGYRALTDSNEIATEVRDIRQYAFEKQPTRVVSLYKRLSPRNAVREGGVIVVNMLPDYFEKTYEGLSELPQSSFLITDARDQLIMQSGGTIHEELLPAIPLPADERIVQADEGSFHVTVKKTPRLNWNLISIVPRSAMYKLPVTLIVATCTLAFASLLLCAALAWLLTRQNYRQLGSIIQILESADSAAPVQHMPRGVRDIYEFIMMNIVETFVEQKYLQVQLSERLYKMQAFEFKALQSQINPHFLYNTLNSIYWKTFQLTKSDNVGCQMIALLSDILQYALDSSVKSVSLKEEIAHIRSYVDIQRLRYKDRIEVIWDIPEAAYGCGVLKLSIQPLIENSIQYGMESRPFLRLKVKARVAGGMLKVTVIDDGPGIGSERLEKLRSALQEETELTGHVGLTNTNKRLLLQYGADARIRLVSKPGYGTAVTLQFPQSAD